MWLQVRLALELVFEGLQCGDHPATHVTGAPAGNGAPSITVADAVTITLVQPLQATAREPQRLVEQPDGAASPACPQANKAEAEAVAAAPAGTAGRKSAGEAAVKAEGGVSAQSPHQEQQVGATSAAV